MSGSTFNWVGGPTRDWATASNWQVGGAQAPVAPNAPTAVAIDNVGDTTELSPEITTPITLGSLSIGGSGRIFVLPEGSLTSLGPISITSTNPGGALVGVLGAQITAPTMTIAQGSIVGGGGTFNVADLQNDGLIQADGGVFDLGPVVVTGGTVTGSGNFEVDGNSTLELGSATGEPIVVNVAASETATIIIDNPDSFTGSINLTNPNSSVNLFLGNQTPTGATYDGKSLIIKGAGGVTLDTIPLITNGPQNITTSVSTLAGFGAVSIGIGSADTIAPEVTAVTASPSDAILGVAAQATLTLGFSEAVTVDATSGTPTLVLNNGASAIYTSGSGTSELVFTYTVATGEDIADLAVMGIALNGGALTDLAGNAAVLTGAAVNPTGTLQIVPGAAAALNTTTNQPVGVVAQAYTGPVANIQNEFIMITPDNLNIAVATPSWFVHSGGGDDAIAANSGTNVLDGGTGSNFLTGGSGANTFFVDNRDAKADTWSTIANFHAGDAVTIWGVTPNDFHFDFVNGQGASGFTGLTLHATAQGRPIASVTLVGFTTADLSNGRIAQSSGTDPASGSTYTYLHAIA